MVSAKQVKELRELTGAGMMDCKKALEECNEDIEKAKNYLREKGITKAAKKTERIATEGIASIFIDGNKALIQEINTETDFVAKNEEFLTEVEKIGTELVKKGVTNTEEALQTSVDGRKVSDRITDLVAKIGEKISYRRCQLVEKTDDEVFGSYIHMKGKIASLVVLDGKSEEVAKNIAMQVSAMKPDYINIDDVEESVLEHEKSIIKKQVINEGKSEDIAIKMVEGRIKKFYNEVCLVEQEYVKEGKKKIKEYLNENNSKVISFIKYEVGEGMQKREDNFAEEVMNQIK